MSYEEVGEELNLPHSTVKKRLEHARNLFSAIPQSSYHPDISGFTKKY